MLRWPFYEAFGNVQYASGTESTAYGTSPFPSMFDFSNLNGRIDKYYMLIRRFVNSGFRLLIRAEWSDSACAEYSDILMKEGGPLW
jgi:hypothetical protein